MPGVPVPEPVDPSMFLPGPAPTGWTVQPHPVPGQKRVVVRVARPGAAVTVEVEPADALRIAAQLSQAARVVESGLVLPVNGHSLGN
jgi:hypothetical protein